MNFKSLVLKEPPGYSDLVSQGEYFSLRNQGILNLQKILLNKINSPAL